MLKQASVRQLRSGEISRDDGFIAITMRFYPRGLKKDLRDDYLNSLAPDEKLFRQFKIAQKTVGHNEAFKKVNYEKRFHLTAQGLDDLRLLSALAAHKDVYLICQCEFGERCHREILMLMAHDLFHAKIDKVFNDYFKVTALLQKMHNMAKEGNHFGP